jgi:hypothetical protein
VADSGRAAAFTAGRHTRAEKAIRRIGALSSVVKTSASAGHVSRCAASASRTTSGSGMVRIDACVLGRREVRRPAGQGDQLPVKGELAAQEVDPVDAEAERLALAEPGARGERDEGSVAVGHGVGEGLDRVDRQGLDPLLGVLGQLRALARRGDDPAEHRLDVRRRRRPVDLAVRHCSA